MSYMLYYGFMIIDKPGSPDAYEIFDISSGKNNSFLLLVVDRQ